jgi:hypothetical protein
VLQQQCARMDIPFSDSFPKLLIDIENSAWSSTVDRINVSLYSPSSKVDAVWQWWGKGTSNFMSKIDFVCKKYPFLNYSSPADDMRDFSTPPERARFISP